MAQGNTQYTTASGTKAVNLPPFTAMGTEKTVKRKAKRKTAKKK